MLSIKRGKGEFKVVGLALKLSTKIQSSVVPQLLNITDFFIRLLERLANYSSSWPTFDI